MKRTPVGAAAVGRPGALGTTRSATATSVAALTAKNPKVSATFTCTDTHDTVGRDTVHIKATAGGDSYRTDTVKLKEGESQVAALHPRTSCSARSRRSASEPRSRSRSRTSTPGRRARRRSG